MTTNNTLEEEKGGAWKICQMPRRRKKKHSAQVASVDLGFGSAHIHSLCARETRPFWNSRRTTFWPLNLAS
jgi:hypothetical protein